MKYLQICNAALAAFGAAMAVCLGVVCLFYVVHLDLDGKLAAQLPLLLVITGAFAGLALAGFGAFLAQRRGWPGRWLVQGLPAAPLAGIVLFFLGLKG